MADFDKKWLERKGKGEAILGSEAIQSLADLGSSFCSRARDAGRAALLDDAKTLVIATVLPLLPLVLTIMPLEELVKRLVKVIF